MRGGCVVLRLTIVSDPLTSYVNKHYGTNLCFFNGSKGVVIHGEEGPAGKEDANVREHQGGESGKVRR